MEGQLKERISTIKAIELLKKDGIVVSEIQAEEILDFMYLIAEIAIDQYLESPKNLVLDPIKSR